MSVSAIFRTKQLQELRKLIPSLAMSFARLGRIACNDPPIDAAMADEFARQECAEILPLLRKALQHCEAVAPSENTAHHVRPKTKADVIIEAMAATNGRKKKKKKKKNRFFEAKAKSGKKGGKWNPPPSKPSSSVFTVGSGQTRSAGSHRSG